MRYLGIIFDQNGKWDAHFDAVLSKVRFATHRICKIIRRGQAPTMPLICDLIKTQVHPIVAYGFPVVHFNKTQQEKLNSLILRPLKRALSVFVTTSHAALFINSRLLDVEGLWKKSAMSYSHRLHKMQQTGSRIPAFTVFDWDWNETTLHLTLAKAPSYTLSFATQLESLQKEFGLSHDHHFSSQQLKEAAARDMLQRKLYQGSHAPFLKYFDVQHEHPTRPDHHLRSDPPAVIALRSRLRLNSTVFNSSLHQRRMTASPDCVYCAATPETVSMSYWFVLIMIPLERLSLLRMVFGLLTVI